MEILFRYLDENYSQIKSTLFYEKNGFTHNNCILHIREKKQNEYMDSLTLSKQDQQIVMECLQSIKENVLLDKEEKADRIDKLIDDINSKKTIAEIQESYNPQFNSLKFLTIVLGTVGTSYLLFSEEDHLSPAMNFVMSMICSACSMKTAYNIASADLPKNEAAGGALAIAGLLGLGGLSLVHQVFLENDVPNNFSCG